jgi:sigma-B regulation protein RsbU (phosphoserine phosphatase)
MDKRPIILLVDDEPFNLDYLEQELEDLEVDILTAVNGQEALNAIAAHQPDLIFLDIMMPVMDGFEVLRRLKAHLDWSNIPVVIVSATSDMPNVVKGIEMGAEDFLPKPFDPVLLHARLNAGLEKKRLRDIERRYLKSLERELEIGREIQADFLPREIPQPQGWEISAFFQAAREVAGDFYDVFELEDGILGVLLGDVTDKGVGAALYMALFRSLLRAAMLKDAFPDGNPGSRDISPGKRLNGAVTLVNNYICQTHDSAMFATLFYGVVDAKSGVLVYVNAGHDYPFLLRNGEIHEKLMPTGPAVGVIQGATFSTQTVQLELGDSLVLYSDGITDAQNERGERFDRERLLQLLEEPLPASQKMITHITDTVLGFVGNAPQYDDISLMVVKRCL